MREYVFALMCSIYLLFLLAYDVALFQHLDEVAFAPLRNHPDELVDVDPEHLQVGALRNDCEVTDVLVRSVERVPSFAHLNLLHLILFPLLPFLLALLLILLFLLLLFVDGSLRLRRVVADDRVDCPTAHQEKLATKGTALIQVDNFDAAHPISLLHPLDLLHDSGLPLGNDE